MNMSRPNTIHKEKKKRFWNEENDLEIPVEDISFLMATKVTGLM